MFKSCDSGGRNSGHQVFDDIGRLVLGSVAPQFQHVRKLSLECTQFPTDARRRNPRSGERGDWQTVFLQLPECSALAANGSAECRRSPLTIVCGGNLTNSQQNQLTN